MHLQSRSWQELLPECKVAAFDISLQRSSSNEKPCTALVVTMAVDRWDVALIFKRGVGFNICDVAICGFQGHFLFWKNCRLKEVASSKIPKEDLTEASADGEEVALEGDAAHPVTQLLARDRPHGLKGARVQQVGVGPAADRVHLALVVGGQADVLQGERQLLRHDLPHRDGIPAVDVATKARRQDGQLFGGRVVTKASNLLRLATNLPLQRADGKGVQGKVVLSRLIGQRLGYSPQGEAAVPLARD